MAESENMMENNNQKNLKFDKKADISSLYPKRHLRSIYNIKIN